MRLINFLNEQNKNAKEHDNNLSWSTHNSIFDTNIIADFFIYFNYNVFKR